MAITENLKKILAAVYGRDVRQSIHDSIQECYNNAEACKSYTNEHVKDMETKMAGITGQSKALMAKTRKDVRNVQAIFSVEKNSVCHRRQLVGSTRCLAVRVYLWKGQKHSVQH